MPYRAALPLSLLLPLALLFAGASSAACVAYDAPSCHVGADCASGVCLADGTCGPVGTGGQTSSSSSSSSSGGICTPGNPAVVTRAEVPLQAGLTADFRAAENAAFSTAGTMNPDGSRTWDLSVAFSGDHASPVTTLPLSTQWFGQDFPGASYAARLSDSADLLGVFTITPTALELVGVASPTSGASQTELKYQPAVIVLAFPVQSGSTWTTTSTVTGQAEGVTVIYTEEYQSSVDAHGTLKTPYATFDVLRVNTLLTRVVGALVTTTRTYSFITGCFGTVGSLVSNTDELQTEFTTAAVVSRLAP
jgi:hypothetical protein